MREINISDERLSRIIDSITAVAPVEEIYVFGSYARGEETPESDLDLYIVVTDEIPSRFELMSRIGFSLLWMDMPKDILVDSVGAFHEKKHSLANVEHVIASEGVKVYDRAA